METPSGSAPASRWRVVRAVLVYGVTGGVLIAALRLTEYRYLVVEHSVEIYGGLVAALFAGVGIWLGVTLTRKQPEVVVREVPVEVPVPVPVPVRFEVRVEVPVPARPDAPFAVDAAAVERLAITPRELEILALIAAGLSNREIAERLFVSENTVKTHSSRVFDKLGARRRTQAVQMGRELGLLPPVAATSGRPKA